MVNAVVAFSVFAMGKPVCTRPWFRTEGVVLATTGVMPPVYGVRIFVIVFDSLYVIIVLTWISRDFGPLHTSTAY